MIDAYVNYLKQLIIELAETKSDHTLSQGKWNKTSFESLSKSIFNKLERTLPLEAKLKKGSTISSRTLYNIFEFKRRINTPMDQRALNTLDKLALYVNLKDWNALVSSYDKNIVSQNGEIKVEDKIKYLISKAKEAEFSAYNQLPEIETKSLKSFFTKKSKAFAELENDLQQASNSGLTISNNFNPSSYEILSLSVEESKLKENHYIASTEEYWILCWYDLEANRYVKKDKKLEKHKYLIKHDKKKGKWLIDVNASSK